jgi:GNAT superfamily N-acetyltransferase
MELGDLPFEVRTFYDFDLEDVIDLVMAHGEGLQGAEITMALSPGPPGGYYGYVAVQDITDRIIGWLSAGPEDAADKSKLRINVVVAADQRRRGVGAALLEHFVAEARAAGVRELSYDADQDDAEAIEFLQKQGFSANGDSDAPHAGDDLRLVRSLT